MVATCFVKRLTTATESSARVIAASPIGSSTDPILRFTGTRHSRGLGSLNRSTSTDSDLSAKLQMTPKA